MPRPGARPRPDLSSAGWEALKRQAKEVYPWVCHRCGKPIPHDVGPNAKAAWTLDHLAPAAVRGRALPTIDQVRPAHRSCNSSHGARLGNEMRAGRLRVGPPPPASSPKPAPAPVPPPVPRGVHHPWVEEMADECDPRTDTWPRIMSGPHPDAVGTYGHLVIERIEKRRIKDPMVPPHEKPLRWFQRLLIVRAYEHDAQGDLVWEYVLQSSNRQVGKSVGVREVCLDRMIHGRDMFGEEQLILHAARDLQVAEEVQLPARLWAQATTGFKKIDTNGKTAIHGPAGRWLVRSERALYGYSASMGMVDECWDVSRSAVSAGIQKTMAARLNPQLWMLSTAHADATDLFPSWRYKAMQELGHPRKTLLVEWSADPKLDEADELGWRQASPFWDARRRELIADDLGTPDFNEQWLNRWTEWRPSSDATAWLDINGLEAAASAPTGTVLAALESDPSGTWAACWGWVQGDEVHVRIEPAGRSFEKAVGLVRAAGPTMVAAHRATRARLESWDFPIVPIGSTEATAATGVLRDVVEQRRLRYTGSLLPYQLKDAVVSPATGGIILDQRKSRGPINAVRATAWLVWLLTTQATEPAGVF